MEGYVMACSFPTTLSEGFAFLEYNLQGGKITHRMRAHLIAGYGPDELATIGPEALVWATFIAEMLPNNASVTGWGTMLPNGSEYHSEPFAGAIYGAHADGTGAED